MGQYLDLTNCNLEYSNLFVGDTNLVSDGYHSFGELYKHRCVLFLTLCKAIYCLQCEKSSWEDAEYENKYQLFSSKRHFADNEDIEGYFVLGIIYKDKQISYHLPIHMWSDYQVYTFAECLENAPEWDGHTPNDVLERLKDLL